MLEPLAKSQWNATTAAHLLNRAGFGGGPLQIESLHRMGLEKAVSWFVDYDNIPDETPKPEWAEPGGATYTMRQAASKITEPEIKRRVADQEREIEHQQLNELRYWWLRRMALGPKPFQEKMTLFWHGHFPSDFQKVQPVYLLWLQNETFRQNALARFRTLLQAISTDPGMLLYLDGAQSGKKHPNENFAREVMELFTLGEGHYTEHDIQEAAKAFTGWGINREHTAYEYHPMNHDDGPKTVFGQTGNFTGEDVLDMICDQPQCAKFMCAKIWRFFVQDQPPPPVIEALAADFQKHHLDLKWLMRTIFLSQEFYAPEVIRSQVKSPVQWLVEAARQLQGPLPTPAMSLTVLSVLGQELFQPPNVKGWDGGIAWITTNSLFNRYNFAGMLVEGKSIPLPNLEGQMKGLAFSMQENGGLVQIEPADVMTLFSPGELADHEKFLAAVQKRFLNGTLKPQRLVPLRDFLKNKTKLADADVRKAIRLVMSTPEYQLT